MTAALASQPILKVVTDEIAAATKPTRRAVIVPVRGMDTYNSNPAVGLTADMLVSIYREAESGRPLRQYDAFERYGIEPDGHLRGLIETRRESVGGSDWVLKPGRQDKQSELAAAKLEDFLRNAATSTTPPLYGQSQPAAGGFREVVEHHLMAPHFGIACTNIVWDIEAGLVVPSQFINAAHRRFAAPSQERAGEIWLVNDVATSLVELEAGLWAVSRYCHRNPWVAGLMRTCMWWAMFKRWSIRDWQVFAEMFGLPLVVGYYEEGASMPSREALQAAVQQIGEDGFAVLSAMTEIVIKDTMRSGDSSTVFPRIASLADEEMSKLVVGGTLNTDVAGVGSYNAATVHESRAYKKERADARRVEEMFTRDIGLPFTIWNGMDRAAPPRLKIQITRDNLERAQVLAIVGQVVGIDKDQIREEFSLRVPPKGAEVFFPTKVAAPPGKPGAPS